jgi:hypothetical protein
MGKEVDDLQVGGEAPGTLKRIDGLMESITMGEVFHLLHGRPPQILSAEQATGTKSEMHNIT